jgi:Zn-dependent protease
MAEQQPMRPRSRWSWQVGSIAGIPIRIHATLAFLLAWIAIAHAVTGMGPAATLTGVLLVCVVFAIIVFHELAHALVARRFGVRTRDILLLPIGGIASLETIPDKPRQELAIAVVGPALNLVLAAVLWLGLALAGASTALRDATSLGDGFVAQLMWINVALAVFNLLPAFPMDGGRALRALLAMRMTRERATDIAAALGRALAVGFGIVGLFYNPWLVLIAIVVWAGAGAEAQMVHLRAAIVDVPVSAAMNQHIDTIGPEQPLELAARMLVATGQGQLPIVDHGATVGVLTRSDVATGFATVGRSATVAAAPHHAAIAVMPDEPLDQVFDQLRRAPEAVVVVIDHGAPVGVLTTEQLGAFVALRQRAA